MLKESGKEMKIKYALKSTDIIDLNEDTNIIEYMISSNDDSNRRYLELTLHFFNTQTP